MPFSVYHQRAIRQRVPSPYPFPGWCQRPPRPCRKGRRILEESARFGRSCRGVHVPNVHHRHKSTSGMSESFLWVQEGQPPPFCFPRHKTQPESCLGRLFGVVSRLSVFRKSGPPSSLQISSEHGGGVATFCPCEAKLAETSERHFGS